MPKEVKIKCAHCGEAKHVVDDSAGIAGVPDTYVKAGEQAHSNSIDHAAEVMKKEMIDNGLRGMGITPSVIKESVQGRISDFNHGKDHNA